MNIHSDFSKANLDQMRDIYRSVGWTKHTNEVIKQIFEASQVIALVEINGRTVGFGRAMTDGVFNAAIYDVVVHQEYQKRVIARKIMQFLLSELNHVSCVHLIATTGKENFYQKLGLKKVKTGMARYINPKLEEEYLD